MRNVHRALTFLGLVVSLAASNAVACANTDEDCELLGEACPGQTPSPTSSGTGGSGGGGTICDMPPRENPNAVSDECGVFVQSGAVDGDGTKAKPLADLKSGVAKAGELSKKRVYVCKGSYTDTLTLPPGLSLYGGFDCENGWAPSEERSALKGTADKIPLTIGGDGASATTIDSFDITSVDATVAGGSSIAAIAQDSAVVHFKSASLMAGRGADGVDGVSADPTEPPTPLQSNNGKAACANSMLNAGGPILENTCVPENPEIPESSIGGKGGDGYPSFGDAGSSGTSVPEPSSPKGQGGQPGLAMCAMGGNGSVGADGAEGQAGNAGASNGTLDPVLGWIGASGGDGKKGGPGQGGGGGGGQKGKQATAMKPTVCAGASGGAGGAGGCGGSGGKGGQAGGSSIAFVSINATVTMVDVVLASSKAGNGGLGGSSQPGAKGGIGGSGGAGMMVELVSMYPACSGGNGGKGGSGGPGGGGAGGHSLGIAYSGAAPTVEMPMFNVSQEDFGMGGDGGDMNTKANKGSNGQAMPTLEI